MNECMIGRTCVEYSTLYYKSMLVESPLTVDIPSSVVLRSMRFIDANVYESVVSEVLSDIDDGITKTMIAHMRIVSCNQ